MLILACGALAREIRDVARLHELDGVTLECLPASLHMTPEHITPAVRDRLERDRSEFDRILIGYADCGTAGELVDLCGELTTPQRPVELMPGAHCYQFFAGGERFDALHDDDPTAFYLTDYLVKHFERLIIAGLGIAEHPELEAMYFGNYTKVIYLAQTVDPVLDEKAKAAADRLGLEFHRIQTGYGELESEVLQVTIGAHT
ncbi:MAG: DUF1638 domain-containing protein [Actinomycetota bacterium]